MLFRVDGSASNNVDFQRMNERAASRQTEAMRKKIFDKWERKVGNGQGVKNLNSARRQAQKELKSLPEYWDEDKTPRRVITPSSSAIASIEPVGGAVYVSFKSNPGKKYYYPKGMGTKSSAANAAEELVTAPSIGKEMAYSWREKHAIGSHLSKKGNRVYEGKIIERSMLGKIGK